MSDPNYRHPPYWGIVHIVPRAEEAATERALMNLLGIGTFIRHFGAALKLFDLAFGQLQLSVSDRTVDLHTAADWAHIAARDGALQIYHVGAVMEGLGVALREAPTLLGMIDSSKRRDGFRQFRRDFPSYKEIRDAIGHSFEEVAETVTAMKAHLAPGPVQIIGGGLNERKYTVTFKGQQHAYEISQESLEKLTAAYGLFLSAFEDAWQKSAERWNADIAKR
jgi:hypothetical protein